MMDLDELRAFVAVVETGSIAAAARSLNFARATLRRRLDELEVRAGVPLLYRTALGVSPTEAGAGLAARGRVILQEAGALLSSVREVGGEPAGVLRVVLPVGLPPQIVTPLVARLRARYPRISSRLRFADDPIGGLLKDVDVAVHFGSRSPAGPWMSYEIIRIREWLVAAPDYLERHGTPTTTDELRGHELMAWASPDSDPTLWPTLDGQTIRVDPTMIATDIHMLRQCASMGLGIAFLPDAMLEDPGGPTHPLVPVLPDIIGRQRSLRVVVPSALSEIPRIRAVLAEIRLFLGMASQAPVSE